MVGNLIGRKILLGAAQDPLTGTSTLKNPDASRCAPTFNRKCIEFIFKPFSWSRVLPDRRIKSIRLVKEWQLLAGFGAEPHIKFNKNKLKFSTIRSTPSHLVKVLPDRRIKSICPYGSILLGSLRGRASFSYAEHHAISSGSSNHLIVINQIRVSVNFLKATMSYILF